MPGLKKIQSNILHLVVYSFKMLKSDTDVATPFVWNNLPRHLWNDDISREQFARDLKTVLFARAYSLEAPLRTSV